MRQPYLNEKQHALAAIVAQPVEHFTRNEGVACSNHVNGFEMFTGNPAKQGFFFVSYKPSFLQKFGGICN